MGSVGHLAGDVLITRSSGNLWRSGSFGVVVLGPSADEPVTLDGAAVAVWDALATPASVDDLVGGLARSYGIDTVRVAADVLPLLVRLGELGVVEIEGE